MIKFILCGDGKIYEQLSDVQDPRQRSHFEFMASNMLSTVGNIECSEHTKEASAVIILDCKADMWDWKLVSSCCSDYGDTLKSKIASIYPMRRE